MNATTRDDALVRPAIRRARRAVAARHLLALHAEGALDEPSRWDWDTLGELPSWMLLGQDERRTLQCIAGLVFLGPELSRLVDGPTLRGIGEAVGHDVLGRVLDDAAERFADAGADDPVPVVPASDTTLGETMARLLGAGASVLHATLGPRLEAVLPLDALRRSTGEPLGVLDPATAERVLASVEALLGGDAPKRPAETEAAA